MTEKKIINEVGEFIDQAVPMVQFGEITISIKMHKGRPQKIEKGIVERAYVEEPNGSTESD